MLSSPSKGPSRKQKKRSTSAAASAAQLHQQVVHEVLENDILLGRGAVVLRNEGNVRFRRLVAANKAEYMSTGKHAVKERVSRRILHHITSERRGRFLRRIETDRERTLYGVAADNSKAAWIIVSEAVSLQKVKQALREQQTAKNAATAKTSASDATVGKSRKSPGAGDGGDASSTTSSDAAASADETTDESSATGLRRAPLRLAETARRRAAEDRPSPNDSEEDESRPAGDNPPSDDDDESERKPPAVPTGASVVSAPTGSGDNSNNAAAAAATFPCASVDLLFRLKHPSLRKRDLSRLRRQQSLNADVNNNSINQDNQGPTRISLPVHPESFLVQDGGASMKMSAKLEMAAEILASAKSLGSGQLEEGGGGKGTSVDAAVASKKKAAEASSPFDDEQKLTAASTPKKKPRQK
jgi:hypothetical protein